MTQPPPNRKVAALYTSSTTAQAMVSSEIWTPTGTLQKTRFPISVFLRVTTAAIQFQRRKNKKKKK
ncbi:hypothetical protein Hdeb2414_s0025g00665051 [Helianthus debilis subsp. tardiflorus]